MSNFLDDNEDLKFYLHRYVDWGALFAETEVGKDPDGFESVEEAKEFYLDCLDLIGSFAANEIAPYAEELDREKIKLQDGEVIFPERLQGIFDQIAEMGLHGLCVPRDLGGMNCPMLTYLVQGELISRADVSVMAHHSFHGGIAMAMLMYSAEEGTTSFDPEALRITETRFQRQISEILNGEAWGCMDITEPDAGSDMGALRTRAEQDDSGQWFLTGQKIFVTSGHGRYHFVICKTEDAESDDGGLGNLSLFLVETFRPDGQGGRERLATLERIEEKMGHHASATVTVQFDRTPAELVGERGQGFKQMLLLMNNARIAVGFESLGICEAAWRMAKEYASVRQSMGKTIDQHELIADMLDDMEVSTRALRALSMRAAVLNELYSRRRLRLRYLTQPDTEEYARLESDVKWLQHQTRMVTPLVKYVGSETAVRLSRMAIQIHGGYGYTQEYGAEKLLRDALVLPIYEGTSQIQSLMATKDALLAITREPARFFRHIANTWRRSSFASDVLERRVARLEHTALAAQRGLMTRILKGKWATARTEVDASLLAAMKNWDPKRDFGPALLHAENLAVLLADVATAKELWRQAKAYPERRELLEGFLERAEPRCADRSYRISSTGDRLLAKLQANEEQPQERSA